MLKITSAAMIGLLVSTSAIANTNIALNKPVTLNGGGWNVGGWGGGVLAPAATVNDGVFKNEGHQWDIDTVWWDANYNTGAEIVINLGGLFSIASFVMQADNNDTYRVEYAQAGGGWATAWDVPFSCCYGVVTRDTTLASTIITDTLRITATGGDNLYSVSEFQAFGQPVPEPEAYALMLAGLGLVGFAARRSTR